MLACSPGSSLNLVTRLVGSENPNKHAPERRCHPANRGGARHWCRTHTRRSVSVLSWCVRVSTAGGTRAGTLVVLFGPLNFAPAPRQLLAGHLTTGQRNGGGTDGRDADQMDGVVSRRLPSLGDLPPAAPPAAAAVTRLSSCRCRVATMPRRCTRVARPSSTR